MTEPDMEQMEPSGAVKSFWQICMDLKRTGSVMPFLQIGGDASSKEGWRIAVSLVYGMTGDREKAAEIIEKLASLYEAGSKRAVYHGRP